MVEFIFGSFYTRKVNSCLWHGDAYFEASSDRSRNKGFLSISCFALCGRVQFAGRSGSEQRIWLARFAEPIEQVRDNDICTSGILATGTNFVTFYRRRGTVQAGGFERVTIFVWPHFSTMFVYFYHVRLVLICQVNVLVSRLIFRICVLVSLAQIFKSASFLC